MKLIQNIHDPKKKICLKTLGLKQNFDKKIRLQKIFEWKKFWFKKFGQQILLVQKYLRDNRLTGQ